MVGDEGVQPSTRGPKPRMFALHQSPMEPLRRIELRSPRYQRDILPFNYKGVEGPTRFELANLRLEGAARSVRTGRMVRSMRFELTTSRLGNVRRSFR